MAFSYETFFKKWAKPGLFLVYFHSFSQHKDKYSTNFTINDKSIDGVLGSRTRGGMMEGADESTELWQHPFGFICFACVKLTTDLCESKLVKQEVSHSVILPPTKKVKNTDHRVT